MKERIKMQDTRTPTSQAAYMQYLSSEYAKSVFSLNHLVMASLKDYLDSKEFMEILPPIISNVTDPGLRGAERIPVSIYGQKTYLTSSMVFHKQILATSFDRIYSFAPNVRLEPQDNATTGRHLVEFCQLDLEVAEASREDSMALADEMIQKVIEDVLSSGKKYLSKLGRTLPKLKTGFPVFTYTEMLDKARKMRLDVKYGEELPQAVETAVSQEIGGFFWIVDYPRTCRSFYYRLDSDGETSRSMDLIYPEGFGEAISGGEREYRPQVLRKCIIDCGFDLEEFSPLLSAAEIGLSPTSGFGIGVERLARYITGVRNISHVRPFPKLPGRMGM
jgi:asparaginyl-tRNA synthetase